MKLKYHEGEITVQKRAGVHEEAKRVSKVIRSQIPPIAQLFLHDQQMVIVSTIDKDNNVWASVLTGNPGFIKAIDEKTVEIDCSHDLSDPLIENLRQNNEIGILAIELSTRRRMKLKGKANLLPENKICVHTERVYSLCPKYIQAREIVDNTNKQKQEQCFRLYENLNEKQIDWIKMADTFFIASYHPETGADVSHRGGNPGFIKVLNKNKILFPDYSGNKMFNTLGNITANPNAGIIFIDFEGGGTLQITGRGKVIWEEDKVREFTGAERLVEFEIEHILETQKAIQFRHRFLEYSPFNPK
ncbi:MAG: pyridoxamine 5'-phosphate oxidase family protein [Thermodesulfobacteriota bacterium]